MKYENYNAVVQICERIRQLEKDLESVKRTGELKFFSPTGYCEYRLSVTEIMEHPLRSAGLLLVETVRESISNEIKTLKEELSAL